MQFLLKLLYSRKFYVSSDKQLSKVQSITYG